MANILSDAKKQQVIALGQLGWTLRRIEAATGVRRETAGAYLKAAGIAVRPPGRWGHPPANPAKEVSTDPTTPAASHRVLYREAHALVDELADAQLAGTRKPYLAQVTTVPLLVLDDLGMKRLPHTAAEDLLEIVMRRYERASTLITSNRPVEDWGKLLGDTAAVTALLDRLLHHAHVLTCGPRSWRTRLHGERAVSGA